MTIKKLQLIPGYKKLFNKAFPNEGINMETFGKAIASYERSLVSGNSKFDKWYDVEIILQRMTKVQLLKCVTKLTSCVMTNE